MSIVVTIVKFPNNVSNTKATLTFTEQGGTIGRGGDNNWILEDPERFISTRHSEISCENGYYFLSDLSTNGTFFNGAKEPVGKGNKVQLNDGDKFELGDYEFQISMWSQNDEANLSQLSQDPLDAGPFAAAPAAASFESASDPFDSPFAQQDDPFASPLGGHVSSAEPLFSSGNEETDPLAALDKAGQGSFASGPDPYQSDVFQSNSHSDQANAVNQAVSWPEASFESGGGGIPEDWDDDFEEKTPTAEPMPVEPPLPVQEPVQATLPQSDMLLQQKNELEVANSKILAEIEQLKQQLNHHKAQPVAEVAVQEKQQARASTSADLTLIEAMGLAGQNLSDEKKVYISGVVGEMVRESIIGMMQVLSSRSNIKNEFRMNVTTIQPVENNPLKFSANVDDAIDNMFLKEGNAYQKPVEAMREGFEGIAEHQIAILAGIRSAFKGVIERFDPATLEKRFEKYHKGRLIPGTQKARNWDSYTEYYKELTDDLDNSFQHLFGYDFVQAYEEQLSRLAIARKTKNK